MRSLDTSNPATSNPTSLARIATGHARLAGLRELLPHGRQDLLRGSDCGLGDPLLLLHGLRLRPGRVVDGPIHVVDLYPTLIRLAGGDARRALTMLGAAADQTGGSAEITADHVAAAVQHAATRYDRAGDKHPSRPRLVNSPG